MIVHILERMRQAEASPPWSSFSAMLLVALLLIFTAFVGIALASLVITEVSAMTLLGWSMGQLLGVALLGMVFRRTDARAFLLGEQTRLPILIAFIMGMTFAVTLDLLPVLVSGQLINAPQLIYTVRASSAWVWGLGIAFTVILQPIAEGLFFHGVLFPSVRVSGLPMTVATVALLHTGYHLFLFPPIAGEVWQGVWIPLLSGIFLAMLRAYDKSPRSAIFAMVGMGTFMMLKAIFIASI